MQILRNLKISSQLMMITVVALVLLATSVLFGLHAVTAALLDDRKQQLAELVEVAQQVVAGWHQQEVAGTLTRPEAQKRALDQLRDIRFGEAKDYYFVQRFDGITVMSPNRELEGKSRIDTKDSYGDLYIRAQIENARHGGGFVAYFYPRAGSLKPIAKLSYGLAFAPWEWAICAGIYIDDIDAAWDAMALKLAGFGIVVSVLMLCVATAISRSIARPLGRLTELLGRLSAGELDTAVPHVDLSNEVGAVARSTEAFRRILLHDKELGRARAAEAEERERKHASMVALTGEFDTVIDEITTGLASASAELRGNARNLSENAEIAKSRAASVGTAAEDASRNVDAVTELVRVMAECVTEIGNAMNETSQVSRQAVSGASAARDTMQQLVEAASSIGRIVSLVEGIASQTNLLALNATIEAARAGEAGKGFAVVAHEVKGLAGKTAEATAQIGRQIDAIQRLTATAMEAINGVVETIESIDRRTIGISAQVQQQEAGAHDIGKALTSAADGTGHVRGSIADVATTATETSRDAAQLLSAADGLSRRSGDLGGAVTKFISALKAA